MLEDLAWLEDLVTLQVSSLFRERGWGGVGGV